LIDFYVIKVIDVKTRKILFFMMLFEPSSDVKPCTFARGITSIENNIFGGFRARLYAYKDQGRSQGGGEGPIAPLLGERQGEILPNSRKKSKFFTYGAKNHRFFPIGTKSSQIFPQKFKIFTYRGNKPKNFLHGPPTENSWLRT
jgi:hypothetical protein